MVWLDEGVSCVETDGLPHDLVNQLRGVLYAAEVVGYRPGVTSCTLHDVLRCHKTLALPLVCCGAILFACHTS